MIAIQHKTRQILGVNRQAYQALKASMSLDLRRQLLIAVCDNVSMQNKLATQLEEDLAKGGPTPLHLGQVAVQDFGDQSFSGQDFKGQLPRATSPALGLERLIFDPEDGNLPKQVAHWVRQTMLSEEGLPKVQVLGIEQMTRQPAITQNHFLRSLEKIEALLPRLNTSLLVWLPWPWLRTIQQSAPTFWNWRTGIFEFVSDPAPTILDRDVRQRDLASSEGADKGPLETNQYHLTPLAQSAPQRVTVANSRHLERRLDAEESNRPSQGSGVSEGPPTAAETDWDFLSEEEVSADLAETNPPAPEVIATEVIATEVIAAEMSEQALNEANLVEIAERQPKDTGEDVNTAVETAVETVVEQVSELASELAGAVSLPTQAEQSERPTRSQRPNISETLPAKRSSAAAQQKTVPQSMERQSAAEDYFAVGMVYRNRIENGERGLELIELAIAAYEGGLRCLSGPHPDWGSGLNDLGTLYWLKAQQLADPQQAMTCMAKSIQLYQEALDKISNAAQPADQHTDDIAGQLYGNMGAVYTMLAAYGEAASYLTQAAKTYQLALPLYSLANEPEEYAALQNSLGSVYWKLSHYEMPAAHLHRAISAYNEALLGYFPNQQPLDYAAVQNNLGITYWSLAKHERPISLLKHSISAYCDALNYRTPEVDPGACAITYNNLALAYWDLAKAGAKDGAIKVKQRIRYQKNAVTAFEAALNMSKAANSLSTTDTAAIFHCLGDVHAQMADTAMSTPEVAKCLQKSLYSYLQAIEGIPPDSPVYQGRVGAIVANLRAHYDQLGLAGQQSALNQVPPSMLSQVMLSL